MRPILLAALLLSSLQAADDLRGFPAEGVTAQRRLEDRFRALPRPARVSESVRQMSRQPHHAGSPGSRAVAEYARKAFQDAGWEARIETFEALLPYPLERRVEMLAPVKFQARLEEPAMEQDPDTAPAGQIPAYHAYSGSADVTAPLVYVNYGLPEDYRTLKELGIDVRGKIVIARYGRGWRGTKPKVAAENGAVGCLIYSDPRDDGYFQGDVYPFGPFRPAQGVQRGSVMDMPLYVGDPLTPGWASEPGARRLPAAEARTLMSIPVLPLSYADARPLLAALTGPVAPEPWRGALPMTYHLGPGQAIVRLHVRLDSGLRPVHNVIASIPGSVWPDEWVLWGNHHDAWVNGAADPATGAAALLEAARSFGEMRGNGWRPSRTLIFALWDAEEFGLVGSTEWVEKHREELRSKAVAYLNTDSSGRGRIGAGSSPLLERFYRQVLRDTRDPRTGKNLIEAAEEDRPLRFSALGAGSDYVAFVHQAGLASLNTGFGEEPGGVYHSNYDTFRWFTRFSDGDFIYGAKLAEVMGVTVLRLSEAPVIPFEFGTLAAAAGGWLEEIVKLAGPDAARLNLRPVSEALAGIREAAAGFEAELAHGAPSQGLAELNRVLRGAERALLLEEGLPDRPWYQHQLYAPGLYTGYSAKTLPGIREAVEAGRWEQANQAARSAARALDRLRERIERAARLAQRLER